MDKTSLLNQVIDIIEELKHIFAQQRTYDIQTKSQGNYVTSMDLQVEDFLVKRLQTVLPGAGFIAEESEAKPQKWNWVIDPIDGTGNFIYGLQYAVSIALVNEHKEPIIGVIYSPTSDELYYAVVGQGAFRKDKNQTTQIHVREFEKDDEGIIIFGMPYDRAKTHKILSVVERLYACASDIKRIGPASLDICRVAEGKAKMYVELDLNIWDFAAGELILKEAGGHIRHLEDLLVFASSSKFITDL